MPLDAIVQVEQGVMDKKCTSRNGTYACKRTGAHEEHAAPIDITPSGRVQVLLWGIRRERVISIRVV